MQRKFNNLSSNGQINLNEEFVQLTVDPAITMSLFSFLSGGDISLLITLEQVTYYFNSCLLTVVTRGYGSQTIIPNVLQLQDTSLTFTVNLQNVSTLVVTFMGDWVIDETTISLYAVYNHASQSVDFRAQLSSL